MRRITIEVGVSPDEEAALAEFFGPGELEMSDEVFELSMELLGEVNRQVVNDCSSNEISELTPELEVPPAANEPVNEPAEEPSLTAFLWDQMGLLFAVVLTAVVGVTVMARAVQRWQDGDPWVALLVISGIPFLFVLVKYLAERNYREMSD